MNNSYFCEFRARTPIHLAQVVEVKGDISLESAQVFGGMGGHVPFVQPGFPQPSFQPSFTPTPPFGAGVNISYGYPSAPPSVPSFPVINFFLFSSNFYSYY